MKGIVFNLLEEVVSSEYGEDTWDTLLGQAGVEGVYTSLGNYPDEELGRLVASASAALDLPADDVVRWFGRRTMPLFAMRYPALFVAHAGWRPFLLGLNEAIHPEVRKLYPGAATPEFAFDTTSSRTLVMEYRSSRQLCAFAEGLMHGVADHYGERIDINRPACLKRGDECCVFKVTAS